MPVIVIGADTDLGPAVVDGLLPRDGEIRVFVTDDAAADAYRTLGVKVAIGDVSDGSHVGGAALNAFSAVLMAAATVDDRLRSFAEDAEEVMDAWAEGLEDAGVRRAIFVATGQIPNPSEALAAATPEFVVLVPDPDPAGTADRIAELDDAPAL